MYTAKNYSNLIGMLGFSEGMMNNHILLYEVYVKNVNSIDTKLADMVSSGNQNSPEYNELKRRYSWEYNGMYLHDLYFENMNNKALALDGSSVFVSEINKYFGSFEKWRDEFISTGSLRGIGWALLVKTAQGELKNIWVNEHDTGMLAGSAPLVVMDVFEHSYMIDYSLKRVDYINAFFKVLDWNIVIKRFEK